MRGLIIWGIWIALAAALAAPQRVLGQAGPSLIGDVPPELADTPVDPVIVNPIRPVFSDGGDNFSGVRDCGSSEVLMMSAGAMFLLMFNLTGNFSRARRQT